MLKDNPKQGTTELTEREREILRMVATGTSNKDIARQLFISSNTVKVHLRNIFSKIGAKSRTEAAMFAIHSGLTEVAISPVPEPLSHETPSNAQAPFLKSRLFLWISILVMALIVGVITLEIIRLRSPKVTSASQAPLATQHWQKLAALPTARSGLAVAVYEDQIYAIGGETAQGITGLMEQYDVTTNAWIKLASKPVPVADINAAVVGGKIYVPGGRLALGNVTDVFESYDPNRQKWESHASLPVALSGCALVAFEGKLYIFGGWDGQDYLASVYEYDPGQDKWFKRSPMPTARAFAGAAIAAGKIYVFGGYKDKVALAVNEQYQPDLDTWSPRVPMPVGRYAMGATSIADLIYVVGGIGKTDSKLSPMQYSFQQDQWQTLADPLPQSWSYLGLVSLQTRLYAIGGRLNGVVASQTLSYQPVFSIFIPVSP